MLKRRLETLSEIIGSDNLDTTVRANDLFLSHTSVPAIKHETFRLEPSDGLKLPTVIAPYSGDTDDFFATVATYYQEASPISALTHVLGHETIELLTGTHKSSSKRNPARDSALRMTHLGAAIGEATLAALNSPESGGHSYAACRRTLSYAIARASFVHGAKVSADLVADRWTRLRTMTGLRVSGEIAAAVLLAHAVSEDNPQILSGASDSSALYDALSAVVRKGWSEENRVKNSILASYPKIERHIDEMSGPFDGRMTAFTRIVESIQSSSHGVRQDEIAVAYLCNRILPGSFAHSGVLIRLMEFYPAALIWYGIFAVASRKFSLKRWDDGLLAKLERDLAEPFSIDQRPRCDISLEELEVLSRATLRPEVIKPSQQRALLVALLPGVDVYTRFGPEANAVVERARSEPGINEASNRAAKLLEEALRILKAVEPADRQTYSAPSTRRRRKDT